MVSSFRPTVGVAAHIEVMKAIGEVKKLTKERDEAKSQKKIDTLNQKIDAMKRHVVWIFYNKPTSLEDI